MNTTLSVYLFGYNLNKILYPWIASIKSALALTQDRGRVYFCECHSDDGTQKDLEVYFAPEIQSGRLVVVRHKWGDHYSIQAVIGNMLLDKIGTNVDYALKLDADEVLCEWSFDSFYEDLELMKAANVSLGRPHYTHLCPDDKHCFPFIYTSKAVISRTALGLRFDLGKGGDACAIGGGREFQTRLEIMHLGKMAMGREREALIKEMEFQQLYTELGFPDPIVVEQAKTPGHIDYMKVFAGARDRGEFQEYNGPYPVFLEDYLREARLRAKAFAQSMRGKDD